jgi:hypothetical protein
VVRNWVDVYPEFQLIKCKKLWGVFLNGVNHIALSNKAKLMPIFKKLLISSLNM